jgi:hypothetical protein
LHIGAKQNIVTDLYRAAIEDDAAKVGEEVIADESVVAVIATKRRLNLELRTNLSEQLP